MDVLSALAESLTATRVCCCEELVCYVIFSEELNSFYALMPSDDPGCLKSILKLFLSGK